jgi:hypothetical protein
VYFIDWWAAALLYISREVECWGIVTLRVCWDAQKKFRCYTHQQIEKKEKRGGLKDSTWQQQPAAAAANQELSYIIAQEQGGCDEKLFTTLCAISISWVVVFFARPRVSLFYTDAHAAECWGCICQQVKLRRRDIQQDNATTSELGLYYIWHAGRKQQQHLVLAKQNQQSYNKE